MSFKLFSVKLGFTTAYNNQNWVQALWEELLSLRKGDTNVTLKMADIRYFFAVLRFDPDPSDLCHEWKKSVERTCICIFGHDVGHKLNVI